MSVTFMGYDTAKGKVLIRFEHIISVGNEHLNAEGITVTTIRMSDGSIHNVLATVQQVAEDVQFLVDIS